MRRALALGICLAVLGLTGCTRSVRPALEGPLTAERLLAHLRGEGVRLDEGEPESRPLFSRDARSFIVDEGEEMFLIEYPSAAEAMKDASQMEREQGLLSPPHFFRRDAVVVLYDGSDARIIRLLRDAMSARE